MKKILFVVQNMNMNGANKSLINLLNVIDKEKYCIDLFVFKHGGILIKEIPSQVNLLPEDYYAAAFEEPMSEVKSKRNLRVRMMRALAAVQKRLLRSAVDTSIKLRLLKRVRPIPNSYDAVIGWTEGTVHSFILGRVDAKVKIGWCHIDDEAWPYHEKDQRKIFPRLDCIVTVSEHCKRVLMQKYGLPDAKVIVCRNIMPTDKMYRNVSEVSPYKNDAVNILTFARNEPLKKTDDVIASSKILYDRGHNIHWWMLGSGFSDEQYSASLPYLSICRPTTESDNYVKWCDIYVQTSDFGEAWGMGVNEAKVFGKPVIVTNIEVFREQVCDGETGLVYDMTVDGLVLAIERLIIDKELTKRIENNIKEKDWSNIEDLSVLYSLIDGVE